MSDADRCVVCGDVMPEGRMVCPMCMRREMVQVFEVCPHCEVEVDITVDIQKTGYEIFCPICGKPMMLCSECQINENQCDFDSQKGMCSKSTKRDGSDFCPLIKTSCNPHCVFRGNSSCLLRYRLTKP